MLLFSMKLNTIKLTIPSSVLSAIRADFLIPVYQYGIDAESLHPLCTIMDSSKNDFIALLCDMLADGVIQTSDYDFINGQLRDRPH